MSTKSRYTCIDFRWWLHGGTETIMDPSVTVRLSENDFQFFSLISNVNISREGNGLLFLYFMKIAVQDIHVFHISELEHLNKKLILLRYIMRMNHLVGYANGLVRSPWVSKKKYWFLGSCHYTILMSTLFEWWYPQGSWPAMALRETCCAIGLNASFGCKASDPSRLVRLNLLRLSWGNFWMSDSYVAACLSKTSLFVYPDFPKLTL